jgi:hypothetical protein
MTGNKDKSFPDKLPAADFQSELNWLVIPIIFGYVGTVYGFCIPEKIWYSGFYGEFLTSCEVA